MKKIKLIFTLIICLNKLNAQITLGNSYPGNFNIMLVKLGVSGYKYSIADIPNMTLNLYNTNHTLFKSITIPPVYGTVQGIHFISETLFDTDNLVEFAVQSYSAAAANKRRFTVFKENGTQIMMRDSAQCTFSNGGIFYNQDGVFNDGTGAKLKLHIYSTVSPIYIVRTEIYNLPGTIPCVECSASGTVTGIAALEDQNPDSPLFYPNPVTDQLKLKYELPKDYKNAEIKIYDMQGKLIDSMKVTDDFNFIYLPSNYNNGLYLYSLVVDGKTIKTEKVILNK